MGAGSSKPEASTGSKHVFTSANPVQFSADLVESLQSSSETDSSRAKSLELQIQARVSEELARLRAREQQTLAEIERRIAEAKEADVKEKGGNTYTFVPTQPAPSLDLDAPRVPFAGRDEDPAVPPSGPVHRVAVDRDLSRESVQNEIQRLREKLEGRRQLTELDESVSRAKQEVVSCLRLNDRRPLDCWKEVEGFKKEVARLEEAFVDRVVG